MVTVEEIKNYLRVDFEDDDALIGALVAAAEGRGLFRISHRRSRLVSSS